MTTAVVPVSHYQFSLPRKECSETAVGTEALLIYEECRDAFKHLSDSMWLRQRIPEVYFNDLKDMWEDDTIMLSSVHEIVLHPAYQKIIGMGYDALPLILNEMIHKGGNWFWALKAISGEDPVDPAYWGNIKEMTKAWIKWGQDRGYIDYNG